MQYPQEFTEAAVNEVETYRHEIDIKITSCELLKHYSALIIVAFARAAIKSRMAMSKIDPAAQKFVAEFLINVQNRKQQCRKVVHVVNNWLGRHVPERIRYAYVTPADCEAEIVASDYHDLLIAYGKMRIENKDPAIKREAESILIDERVAEVSTISPIERTQKEASESFQNSSNPIHLKTPDASKQRKNKGDSKPTEEIEIDPIAVDRAELLHRNKAEGKKLGITITDEMIAEAARPSWHDRTPVQRWKRNDSRSTPGDDAAIQRVLKLRPHLK